MASEFGDLYRSTVNIGKLKVPLKSMVKDLVMKKMHNGEYPEVFIVGERNFTFTVALTALRGSWSGIVATCVGDNTLLQIFYNVLLSAMEGSISNGKKMLGSVISEHQKDRVIAQVTKISKVSHPTLKNVRGDIDCTNSSELKTGIVWFQCPWKERKSQTGKLLVEFLCNMNRQQNTGGFVLIGIANHPNYIHEYELEALLRYSKEYSLLGADNFFIREILAHGYKHESDSYKDIHDYIFHSHITLVFQKVK